MIDDSYNANPVGVHNGLEVLAAMSGAHKFLITPGLVELGSVEDEENRRYGEHAAKVCDARHRDVGEDQRGLVRRAPRWRHER